MEKVKRELNVPWITKEGYFDPSKFPIDGVLKQALSKDFGKFHSGCNMLQTMHQHGRAEAGIYLLGLLRHYQNDIERAMVVVEKLSGFHTAECADALFSELFRVKSSNTTRKYLNSIIKVLSYFPKEIVQERFHELAEEKSFSYKMRRKFRDIIKMTYYRSFD